MLRAQRDLEWVSIRLAAQKGLMSFRVRRELPALKVRVRLGGGSDHGSMLHHQKEE